MLRNAIYMSALIGRKVYILWRQVKLHVCVSEPRSESNSRSAYENRKAVILLLLFRLCVAVIRNKNGHLKPSRPGVGASSWIDECPQSHPSLSLNDRVMSLRCFETASHWLLPNELWTFLRAFYSSLEFSVRASAPRKFLSKEMLFCC